MIWIYTVCKDREHPGSAEICEDTQEMPQLLSIGLLRHPAGPRLIGQDQNLTGNIRLAPVVFAINFCHSLSLPVALFISLIHFHYFTTETFTKRHN